MYVCVYVQFLHEVMAIQAYPPLQRIFHDAARGLSRSGLWSDASCYDVMFSNICRCFCLVMVISYVVLSDDKYNILSHYHRNVISHHRWMPDT